MEVDARGLSCPIPVMRTRKALETGSDEIVVLVDARVQVENVGRLARNRGYEVQRVDEEGDVFRVVLVRGRK